jgi:hypothetical protein
LGQIATKFFKKMIQYTQEEYVTDLNEIENLIREDFISLDESLLSNGDQRTMAPKRIQRS